MKLAEISIRRAVFATMLIAALMVFGLFSLPRIGVELFPNVEFPVITTTVIYPGADPETMESKVADPIEEALQSLSGVKRMTSRNYEGVTSVILEFELEVDGAQVRRQVRSRPAVDVGGHAGVGHHRGGRSCRAGVRVDLRQRGVPGRAGVGPRGVGQPSVGQPSVGQRGVPGRAGVGRARGVARIR